MAGAASLARRKGCWFSVERVHVSALRCPFWCTSLLLSPPLTQLLTIIALQYQLSYEELWEGSLFFCGGRGQSPKKYVFPRMAVLVAGEDVTLQPREVPRSKLRSTWSEVEARGQVKQGSHLARLLSTDTPEERGGERAPSPMVM